MTVWYIYRWGNNPVRARLKGKLCEVLARGALNSVLIEFKDGFKVVTSANALAKVVGARE